MWSALVVAVLTAGVMGYFWIKQTATLNAKHDNEVALLRVQNRENLEAIAALSTAVESMREAYVVLDKDKRWLRKKLQEEKASNAESAAYLNSTVPDGVRKLVEESSCLQVPGSCGTNRTHGSGVPGDND